jgi:uncharacterized protein DUF4845
MESNRRRYRMTSTRRAQAGITALGFLCLATLVGVVGLALVKLTPMYLRSMRMDTVLEDVQRDLNGQAPTPATIRNEIAKRFTVEDINMDVNALKITQSQRGYTLRVAYEERAPYIAGVYLLMPYDKQVEILR